MNSQLVIRMSKNIFLKDKNYTIRVNNTEPIYTLNTMENRIKIDLKEVINTVEVSAKGYTKTYKMTAKNNEIRFLNVYPNLTFDLALGIVLGFSFLASICILLVSNTEGVRFLLIPIPFLSLLFLKRKHFQDRFELKETF